MPIVRKPAKLAPWPPEPGNDLKGRYPEPFPVSEDPNESFWTIADKTGVAVEDLVRYNFLTNKPEEINYYLREYVGCVTTTKDGNNYMFRNAPRYDPAKNGYKGVIFVPRQAQIHFEDPPPIIVARKAAGAIRWILLATETGKDGKPTYLVPGVERTSRPVDSQLPGNSGAADRNARALAALARFVASTASSWLADRATGNRLESLEPSYLNGGAGVGDQLQPRGKHEAVIVMVRKTKSKVDRSFPKLPFGKPIIVGYCDVADAHKTIERFHTQGGIFSNPGPNQEVIVEYYLGTRLQK